MTIAMYENLMEFGGTYRSTMKPRIMAFICTLVAFIVTTVVSAILATMQGDYLFGTMLMVWASCLCFMLHWPVKMYMQEKAAEMGAILYVQVLFTHMNMLLILMRDANRPEAELLQYYVNSLTMGFTTNPFETMVAYTEITKT